MRVLSALRGPPYVALLPYVAPLVVLLAEWGLLSPTPALADHFQFWAAGHMVANGLSPYDRSSWIDMAGYGPRPDGIAMNTVIGNLALTKWVWLYPPQTAFAFAPFGVLPLDPGIPLLHLAVVATAIAGVLYAARVLGLDGARLAFALTLVAISQPFVIGVRDGHPLGAILGGLVAALVGARDRRAAPLVIGALIVSLKPHIAIGFAVMLLVYLALRREWRLIAWPFAALVLVTVAADLVTPFPLAALSGAADERFALDLSNVSALARDLGGGGLLAFAIAGAAVVAAAGAVRLAQPADRPRVAFAAALAVSLVVSPYAHDYDQLLNVPAAMVALTLIPSARAALGMATLAAAMIAVVPWVLFFWYPLLGQPDRIYQAGAIGALPVLTVVMLLVATVTARGGTAPRDPARTREFRPAPGMTSS